MNRADRHLMLAVANAHACHLDRSTWIERRRTEARVASAAQAARPITPEELRDVIALGVQHGEWLAGIRARWAQR